MINLIIGPRNMIKASKNTSLQKLEKRREPFLPNTDIFLALFIVFEWGRIFESAMDK